MLISFHETRCPLTNTQIKTNTRVEIIIQIVTITILTTMTITIIIMALMTIKESMMTIVMKNIDKIQIKVLKC